jgi:hypothetical protein
MDTFGVHKWTADTINLPISLVLLANCSTFAAGKQTKR